MLGMKDDHSLQVSLQVSWAETASVLQGLTIDPAHLIVQTGCGAILNNMFMLMCEPGDGILVPAPYYPGFDSDMKVRYHQLQCCSCYCANRVLRASMYCGIIDAWLQRRADEITRPQLMFLLPPFDLGLRAGSHAHVRLLFDSSRITLSKRRRGAESLPLYESMIQRTQAIADVWKFVQRIRVSNR